MRQALSVWDFGQVSRLVRKRSSLRQEDIAALTGLRQSFLSMLESGDRRLTNIDKIIAFLSGLGTPAELVKVPLPEPPLRYPQPPVFTATTEDQDPDLPWTVDRMVTALNQAVGGGAMNRRRYLAVSGIALTAYVHNWSVAEAEPLVRAQEGSRISGTLLKSLQKTTNELRVMDASSGGGDVTKLGDAHLTLLRDIAKYSNYDEASGRMLAGIIADTATQTGWFTFDSGQSDEAQLYFQAALRAARASGDPRLGAGALSYMAIRGYSAGAPRDAVTAARTALEKVRALGAPALEAMLLTRQARGHAKLGEQQAALKALGQAAELCAQGRSEHDPHWLYWINEGEIHGQAGSCHLDLGNPRQAISSLIQAGKALNPADLRTRALILSRAATAQFREGDLEAGCATAHDAIDLAAHLQSARLNEHVHAMAGELSTARTAPYARELLERCALVTGKGKQR
ncbi:helix-turn-helix domain-containing protein [Streptomyces sp. NPDC101227]|uniref:helix-turn-helix domain-containing protein n=1 Tax=Streptomyces sp. NPDC101227 TaxID=3366136 RepID=UPI0037F98575